MGNSKIQMITMTEKFKILAKYIKDMSSETPDIETYIYVKDYIAKYKLNIDIKSKPLKNKMIEVDTILKFEDKETNKKKSYFEIVYSVVAKIDEDIKVKKDLEKIILCDIPNKVWPDLENAFLNLIHNSGHPSIKLEKKIDFNKLYNERFN